MLISYNLQASKRDFQKTMKKRERDGCKTGTWKLKGDETAFA